MKLPCKEHKIAFGSTKSVEFWAIHKYYDIELCEKCKFYASNFDKRKA